jgi:phosphoribosyl 1,2-cyclic phosphate phosphodiesterase
MTGFLAGSGPADKKNPGKKFVQYSGCAGCPGCPSIPPMAGASFLFLGTGTSVGVPVIGCGCAVCQSGDPRNRRLRSSAVFCSAEATVLVDSGPDLRAQALREGLHAVDAVIYTHAHLDHVAGFDELRAFCWHREDPLPLHATRGCMETLVTMFGWAFSGENCYKGYVRPAAQVIDGPFGIGALRITPLPVDHAAVETIGFRFDLPGARSLAYLPDVKRIPQATLAQLRGVDVLIVDALRPNPHPTHFSLAEALAAISAAGPGEAWLTHLGHENDHPVLEASLPAGVRVACDGLRIEL